MHPHGVTELLLAWRAGDESALERLVTLVYDELRNVARNCLRREPAAITIDTSALVNETYLRLVRMNRVQWRDRAHFFAVMARVMRRVLVDEARKRRNRKHGGDLKRVSLNAAEWIPQVPVVDLLALDQALERMAEVAPRKSQVIELRFFAGLTIEETAAALDISVDTVKREWRTAKLWLIDALREPADGTRALEAH